MNRAQRALDSVQRRPRDVVRWSQALLDDPTATPEEQVGAAWALGRAYAELDQIEHACTTLERSIALAVEHDIEHLAADVRVSLSGSLVAAGRIPEAIRELDLAEPHLDNPHLDGDATRGRHAMQRGFVAMHVGDLERSLEYYDTALAHLDGGADEQARARSLINRGIANTMTGKMQEGQADFVAVQELAEHLGLQMLAAGAAHNLGFYAGRAGDVPTALRWFGRARTLYEELGSPGRVMSLLESDFSTVLLTGGLYAESAAAATRAAAMAARAGNRLAEAEAHLLLARAELAARNHDRAEDAAAAAAAMFRQSDREPWAAIAEYVGLQGAALATSPSVELLDRTKRIAELLQGAGWWREGLEAKTLAARLAVSLGRLDEARAHLTDVAGHREGRSAALRATVLLATATLHLADADRAGAAALLAEAMDLVEDHRATLGSTELRAHASINGSEIARMGLRMATEDGDPSEIFHWAERWRAGSLQIQMRGPDGGTASAPDRRLAAALTELREAHRATIDGTTDPFDIDSDRRIAKLERQVRKLSREQGTSGFRQQQRSLGQLQACLGGRLLIEYIVVDGNLYALTAWTDDATLHDLGDVAEIERRLNQLTMSLNRLAHHQLHRPSERLDEAIVATAAKLEERLLAGITVPTGTSVIVVPTQPLQMMPWAALPSLVGSTVTVTPSSWLWARAGAPLPPPSGSRALLVCGPDLPGGHLEVDRLARLYADPVVLGGEDASVERVVEAMGSADVAHIAAHGSFRSDNPMLSGLRLHDGPLTVYDLESLPGAPRTVVLPACNAARSSVYDGDELLGTAAALLQAGVRSVIAPVTVVPDSTLVPDLMVELHRELLAGRQPSEALAVARRNREQATTPGEVRAALSFIAIDSRPGIAPEGLLG